MNQATIDELVDLLTAYNQAYRQGTPMVDDAAYDDVVERLRAIAPDHPFLQAVEPEQFTGRQEVRHPAPMLSIEKAYTVNNWNASWPVCKKKPTPLGWNR
jgi:DNA ligase (NAD+)